MKNRIEFDSQGNKLSGLMESPAGEVRAYALFAHCFTCGKDIAAASRISRALTQQGYAVLRFDFTGLGNSDGDFSNTNFSSNLDDLLAAAAYLRDNYAAPQLLIGHSLGGAAVLSVANDIPEVKGVVSIAAPADAQHVIHNFDQHLDEINSKGIAKVRLGMREFTIKKQFIDDVAEHSRNGFNLRGKALLVMHSPLDATVAIADAEKIYSAAKHPKSFVSLDQADHLLSNKTDAEYAALVISAWADKYVDKATVNKPALAENGSVVVSEKNHQFTLNVVSDSHYWLADEPLKVGGNNLGPDPYEHLLAALGACTVMTLRMYASRKKLMLEDIQVTLTHQRNYFDDCQNSQAGKGFAERIHRQIKLSGDITTEQRQRLLEIADKCPVHKTLQSNLIVTTQLDA
ncbi:bifunctional alpha/beta hydrolase/OsmC family protein [Psychromonas sp. Urea-02u-13]|uniref:bifunctional alpha/beta hydrolase/OsmC family protein n=1 Tax=Psychromonas sp. Urea-02u-13 TaxID=2058326 RepID=UPI000C32259E|nr:alpha/beta fold hydrolase [Psychromonas sp. Urea-02u-13]PKG37826.1 osmotically inducible protein C [Psychromonas sp. Urea-02u-13]